MGLAAWLAARLTVGGIISAIGVVDLTGAL